MISPLSPQAESSEKGVRVGAFRAKRRQLLEQLDIASAEHHVIGLKRGGQLLYNIRDILAPLLLTQPLQASKPHIVLKRRTSVRPWAMLCGSETTIIGKLW